MIDWKIFKNQKSSLSKFHQKEKYEMIILFRSSRLLFFFILGGIMAIFSLNSARGAELKEPKESKESNFLYVGAASVDITPTESVWLGGFASRTKKSEGVRSPIFARVLDLQKGKTRLIWIVCDLLGFEPADAKRIRALIAQKRGLSSHNILLSATHTHSAPAVKPIGTSGAKDYLENFLIPRLLIVADQAASSKEPCQLIFTEGKSGLAHDRRNAPIKGDGAAPDPDPKQGYVDQRVPAFGFRKADGSFKAILLQYAMHPTSHSDYLIGSEWPGATCQALQRIFGTQTVPFVLQGAAGNLGSPKRRATSEEMRAWGEELAGSITDGLESGAPVSDPCFTVRTKIIPVALENMSKEQIKAKADEFRLQFRSTPRHITGVIDPWEKKSLARMERGEDLSIPADCAVVILGSQALVTTPFETFCHLNGLLSGGTPLSVHVIGYTNGVYNYFPTRAAIAQGGYEPAAYLWYGDFPTASGALEKFAEDLLPLINGIGTPSH